MTSSSICERSHGASREDRRRRRRGEARRLLGRLLASWGGSWPPGAAPGLLGRLLRRQAMPNCLEFLLFMYLSCRRAWP